MIGWEAIEHPNVELSIGKNPQAGDFLENSARFFSGGVTMYRFKTYR